jgi:hypothetical protein
MRCAGWVWYKKYFSKNAFQIKNLDHYDVDTSLG